MPDQARGGRGGARSGHRAVGAGGATAEDHDKRDEREPKGWDEDEEHLMAEISRFPALTLERRDRSVIG
ncbi:MAG: hypothetical protein ABR992_16775 [Solirubrobacteraceae bacterium]